MTPVKQTRLSDEKNGIHGNCFTACLASLLDLRIEDVPDFSLIGSAWADNFFDFLGRNGCEFNGLSHFEDINQEKGIDGFLIVGGESPRGTARGHSVIYKDGKPFFDPHPSNQFLIEPVEVYCIERKKNEQ